jgi:hypothetical protein
MRYIITWEIEATTELSVGAIAQHLEGQHIGCKPVTTMGVRLNEGSSAESKSGWRNARTIAPGSQTWQALEHCVHKGDAGCGWVELRSLFRPATVTQLLDRGYVERVRMGWYRATPFITKSVNERGASLADAIQAFADRQKKAK